MIWTHQAHFTTLYRSINQGNSETQRKPTALFVAFTFSLRPIHAQTNSLCYKGSQYIRSKANIENDFLNYKTK